MKRHIFLPLILIILLLCGCGKASSPVLKDCAIESESEFGGIYICKPIDEFNAMGFEFGDSVDISFSNGYEIKDIPYYNGYYNKPGETLLVGYPGYPYIKAAINTGSDLWGIAGLKEGDTATVKLDKKGKYLDLQEAMDLSYTDDRNDYASDEIFANFREVKAGDIKSGILFRSASPCDNKHKRTPYVNDLISDAGVKCILDLGDNEERVEGYFSEPDYSGEYYRSLYESGNVILVGLKVDYTDPVYKEDLAKAINLMTDSPGPYLVHCTEGKDRTGFVCVLFESLCGADYDEIKTDYMISYENYFGINEKDQKKKYDLISDSLLNPMIRCLAGDENADVKKVDLKAGATNYLLDAGLSSEQINKLIDCLTK